MLFKRTIPWQSTVYKRRWIDEWKKGAFLFLSPSGYLLSIFSSDSTFNQLVLDWWPKRSNCSPKTINWQEREKKSGKEKNSRFGNYKRSWDVMKKVTKYGERKPELDIYLEGVCHGELNSIESCSVLSPFGRKSVPLHLFFKSQFIVSTFFKTKNGWKNQELNKITQFRIEQLQF